MARTFLRQDTQILNSDLYDDTIAPTQAAYETNPTNIETDLNTVRSQLQNFLNRSGASFPTGNWYDDLTAPITFENGTQRGIDELNQQLHDLERKRVLVECWTYNDVPVGIQATGTLTTTGVFSSGETVTVGTQTYTLTSPFVNAANNIDASGTTAQTLENLRRAINGDGVAGTNYGTGTTVNASAYATNTATTLDLLAKVGGTAGNAVATTETCANASFGASTLTGGTDSNIAILNRTSILPVDTTLAVGAVTTLGTVVAFNASFGTHSLDAVAGNGPASPKNLIPIVDYLTHDTILSDGRTVYGLLQSESSTDGSTATITTPNRVQISFVRLDATGIALEAVPIADISGAIIHYAATCRKALEDFNEQDFLRGTAIDMPFTTTVTRQNAYDNQGATPVDILSNAILDLDSTGIYWTIRDTNNAELFTITEGASGSSSTVAVPGDVDFFDVNAADNDFLNGASFDTGAAGTTINVGVTANQIDAGGVLAVASGGSADLNLVAALEMNLTDSYRSGSTWSLTDGIALANSPTEWSNFETAFGEVSLLNAIYQAWNAVGSVTKTYANVTSTTVADTDVGGTGGGTNLDTQLQDLSLGVFLQDYDVFLNGQLLRPGADASANNDYYPGTSLANGQLKFEFTVKINDVLCVIARA